MVCATGQVLDNRPKREWREEWRVTYQLTMKGRDGIVIVSDRCEHRKPEFGEDPIINMVRKLRISSTGAFAWAFYGGTMGPVLSKHLRTEFDGVNITSDDEIMERMEKCRQPAYNEWHKAAAGPAGDSQIVFACGLRRSVFRCNALPVGEVEKIIDGIYISGDSSNPASLLPKRLYSSAMTVDALADLGAYTVRVAHMYAPQFVDGLDIAIYRNSAARFKFLNPSTFSEKAIAKKLRKGLGSPVR